MGTQARFVKFVTWLEKKEVWINADKVATIENDGADKCRIWVEVACYGVLGSADTAVRRLNAR